MPAIEVSSSVLFVHGLSGKLLSNHVTHNSHHSCTSVVDLSIKLTCLLLWVKDVVSEVTYTVVSIVLGSWKPSKLNESKESDDLCKSCSWYREKSVNSGWDIGELKVVRWGDVSIEYDVVVVYDGSYNSCHSNTSVLTLNSTTTLESLWLSLEPSKRIENSKWLSCSKLDLRNLKGGGCLYKKEYETMMSEKQFDQDAQVKEEAKDVFLNMCS